MRIKCVYSSRQRPRVKNHRRRLKACLKTMRLGRVRRGSLRQAFSLPKNHTSQQCKMPPGLSQRLQSAHLAQDSPLSNTLEYAKTPGWHRFGMELAKRQCMRYLNLKTVPPTILLSAASALIISCQTGPILEPVTAASMGKDAVRTTTAGITVLAEGSEWLGRDAVKSHVTFSRKSRRTPEPST